MAKEWPGDWEALELAPLEADRWFALEFSLMKFILSLLFLVAEVVMCEEEKHFFNVLCL